MPPAYEVLLLNTAIPQIQAAQSGDTYLVPRDIAFSAALTLSAGTANGVPYLSSPGKVLTTGSALTFDGTNLGLSNSAVATVVKIDGSGRYKQFETYQSGTREFYFGYDSTNLIGLIYQDNNRPIAFGIAGSEAMRLTSTGLGIGTNNPAAKLEVSSSGSSGRILLNGADLPMITNGYDKFTSGSYNGAGRWGLFMEPNALTFGLPANAFATFLWKRFNADSSVSSTSMTLDASGNLGLGVTPSAWASGVKALQIGSYSSLYDQTGATVVGNNFYNIVAGSRYLNTNNASAYVQTTGQHQWFTAPSGTAGNAISFTQAMTLDASGNLGIGDSTISGYRFNVKSADDTASTFAAFFRNSSSTNLLVVRSDGYFATGTAANSPYNSTTASAANVVVDSGGQLFRSTSSLKYKRDVQDAKHGLAEVMGLRPVTYKGKNDGDTVFGGLIAEEVHAAGLTEFVQYAEDGSPDALAYSNMVSLLVKAIQEQQAMINELKAEVAALKGA